MTKSYSAKIVADNKTYQKPLEASPEPGQYQQETIGFAKGMNKVDFGSKYEFKADKNPAPG